MLRHSVFFTLFIVLLPVAALAQAKRLPKGRLGFSVSQAPWNLVLPAEGFAVSQQKIKPDGSAGYFLMSSQKYNMTASLWIEPADRCRTSKDCRDMVLKVGNPAWGEYQDLLTSELGDVSFFEFFRPTVQEIPVKMLDMYAEFVRDDYWIDLHISKLLYRKEDHVLLENLIKSAAFEPKTDLRNSESQ